MLASPNPCLALSCSEAYHWVKDRRPQIAITADDAQRLQAAEPQLLGATASGFQVPIGQQPAGGAAGSGQHQQQQVAGPFGWPAFGAGGFGSGGGFGGGGAGPAGAHTLNPAQQPSLNFGAAQVPAHGAFVFGASQQQQQQQQHVQQQEADMMD
jgi:hypothetical protein